MKPSRYHLSLRLLHWVSAFLLIVGLAMGTFVLNETPNSDPHKINALRGHMIFGALIFILTAMRVVARLRTRHPEPALTGIALADRLAPLMHWGLYALIVVMVISGASLAASTGLPDIVFAGHGFLPADFRHLPARTVHGVVAKILTIAVILHVIAALFHQFIRKDRLLSRMWFGK